MFNPLDLSNKKILVTGASSGIGRASAIYLSKLGAQIVLTGRNEQRLNETLNMLDGKNHIVSPFDLTNLNEIEKLLQNSVKDGIKLNGLVHSAGIAYVMPLRVLTPDRMQEAFEADYFCFVELVRQYSKKAISDGGSIVCISSVTSVRPVISETAYATAKAAMNASVVSMSLEIAKKNIRINGILAGNIMTEMSKEQLEKNNSFELKQKEVEQSLVGRWGTPDDIASAVAFLQSDMSSFIAGTLLDVGGGY